MLLAHEIHLYIGPYQLLGYLTFAITAVAYHKSLKGASLPKSWAFGLFLPYAIFCLFGSFGFLFMAPYPTFQWMIMWWFRIALGGDPDLDHLIALSLDAPFRTLALIPLLVASFILGPKVVRSRLLLASLILQIFFLFPTVVCVVFMRFMLFWREHHPRQKKRRIIKRQRSRKKK